MVPTELVEEFKGIIYDIQRSGHYRLQRSGCRLGNQALPEPPIPRLNVCGRLR